MDIKELRKRLGGGEKITLDMDMINKATAAMLQVKALHPGTPPKMIAGVMECLKCGGPIRYIVSSRNGHSHGQCKSE